MAVRLTPDEYRKLEKEWNNSLYIKLSEYVRRVTLNRKVVMKYRDKSLDDLTMELSVLRGELNRIGVNYNQSIKRLHTLRNLSEFKRWFLTNELEKRMLENKIEEIKNYFKKNSAKMVSVILADKE